MKVAAIDLGTNTFLLLVAEAADGKIEEVVHDEVQIVRLGEGVSETKVLQREALERARKCFASFAQTLRKFEVTKVLACATSAARDATNFQSLVDLGKQFDIPIEVISGEKEAELTFWGTLSSDIDDPVLIIDVGGGSTEFILGDRTGLAAKQSLDIGAVRLTEMFVTEHPVPQNELDQMTAYAREKLTNIRGKFPIDEDTRLLAVAGTPTTLAALDKGLSAESDRVNGYRLTAETIEHWFNRLAKLSVEERRELAGMEPKRADVIVAGALILMLGLEILGAKSLEVSVRGLRYGIARMLAAN